MFALAIVRSILPAFDDWEKQSREKINRINRTLTVYEKKIEKAKRKTQEFAASSAERKAGAIATAEGILGWELRYLGEVGKRNRKPSKRLFAPCPQI